MRKCLDRILIVVIIFSLVPIVMSYSFASAKPEFDADLAFKYLQKQCSFGPRPPGSSAHKQTRDYLSGEMKKFAKSMVIQDFSQNVSKGTLSLTNIIATFGPQTNRKVLLAAHWDTRPFADRDPNPNRRHLPILGANDGASGVAILLELCRILHANPPKIQVIVVLFDGEDYGKTNDEMFLGSRYFAKNIDKKWIPDYGILIDMVGDKDLDIYIEQNSARFAPDIVDKVWKKANELGLKCFHNKPGSAILDDHIPLLEIGMECIDIIDINYPYWHTLEDTVDKCSPKSLGCIGRLLLELIYE